MARVKNVGFIKRKKPRPFVVKLRLWSSKALLSTLVGAQSCSATMPRRGWLQDERLMADRSRLGPGNCTATCSTTMSSPSFARRNFRTCGPSVYGAGTPG
jgi:hypothetical protein